MKKCHTCEKEIKGITRTHYLFLGSMQCEECYAVLFKDKYNEAQKQHKAVFKQVREQIIVEAKSLLEKNGYNVVHNLT